MKYAALALLFLSCGEPYQADEAELRVAGDSVTFALSEGGSEITEANAYAVTDLYAHVFFAGARGRPLAVVTWYSPNGFGWAVQMVRLRHGWAWASIPVGGTPITSRQVFGEWTVRAKLDDREVSGTVLLRGGP